MHKLIVNKLSKLTAAATLMLAALLPTSCSDETLSGVVQPNADGTYGPLSLTVSLDFEENGSMSRSTFETNNFEINEAWVAIFDPETKKLVGMTTRDFGDVNTPPDTSHGKTENQIGDDYAKVTFDNLFINDDNTAVYIVGVVNYEGILAYTKVPDENDVVSEDIVPLIDVLNSVTCLDEFLQVAVHTASAEYAVQNKNAPLMSGMSSGDASHQNFTMNHEGVATPEIAKTELFDHWTRKFKTELDGKIHLRRLVDHINVTVNVGNNVTLENPTVQVYNIPKSVFIQERTTVENAAAYSAEDWRTTYTTASSDSYGGYYDLKEGFGVGDRIVDTRNAGFFQNDDDRLKVSGKTITFGYWHFENKHWGLPACNTINKREARFGTSDVYTSLCPSESNDFNNGATYMVIRGKVKDSKTGYTGDAEFYIHEGYCCNPDGTQATDLAVASRDFATFRNTNYNYTIDINGLNDVIVKVTNGDLSSGNPGAGGVFWNETDEAKSMSVDRVGNTYNISLPEGTLYWCIEEDDKYYGVPMAADYSLKDKFKAYPNFTAAGDFTSSELYKHITLDGQALGTTSSFDAVQSHTLKFDNNTDANGSLYICAEEVSADGKAKCYIVYKFTQTGKELDVIRFDAANIIWHNNWYEYTTANVWVGCPNSIINVLWYHDSRIKGYNIDVYDLDGNAKMKSFSIEDATPYLKQFNGKTIFFYPLNTTGLPAGGTASTSGAVNYSFDITPIVDETQYKSGGATQIRGDKTERTIRICPSNWEIGAKKEWDVAVSSALQPGLVNEIYLRGLRYYQSSKTDGTSSKVDDKDGYYIQPGGGGNLSNRYFSFYATSSGKVTAKISNNGGDPTTGKIVYAYKMNPDGSGATEIYNSTGTTMGKAGTQTAFTFNVTIDGGPQEIRIYTTGGGVRYYSIAYTPN